MATEDWNLIQELFEQAVELTPAEQAEFLDKQCAEDAQVRRKVEELLRADSNLPAILESGPEQLASLMPDDASGAQIPDKVGPYHIDRLIGRGGMGIVLLAERQDLPRKVALKLVTDRWIGSEAANRFRREQAVLARLQHPNIARLLDTGTADDGTPYLTMDYVDGISITEYCTQKNLPIDERLELFLDVCAAVQHAHQNLIIHRDLKPSNILVDASGTIKLLDFGISKLLESEENPGATRTLGGIMTPAYASPEQFSGDVVSTGSDVYSLGVILYELLAGKRPYEIDGVSMTEAVAIITKEIPQPPSLLVTTGSLNKRIRGDLDNIVMKALQKSATNRYGSVEALSRDIRRHLNGLPVEAREAGRLYRTRRFVTRHKWGVGVGLIMATLLVAFSVVTAIQQSETARERDRAERTVEFLMGLFAASDPSEALGDTLKATQLLSRGVEQAESLSDQPLLQAETFDVIGNVYASLGQYTTAVDLLERSIAIRRAIREADPLDLATSLRHLAAAQTELLLNDQAAAAATEALEIASRNTNPPSEAIAAGLTSLALTANAAGEFAKADSLLVLAHGQMERAVGPAHSETISILANRVNVLHGLNRFEEAEVVGREVLAWCRANLPPNHPRLSSAVDALAVSLRNQRKFEEARPLYEEAMSIKRAVYGNEHPSTALSVMNMAIFLGSQQKYAEAEPYFVEAVEIYTSAFGADNPRTAYAITAYAVLLGRTGRFEEAAAQYREALEIQERGLGLKHPSTIHSLYNLGLTLGNDKRFEEALPILENAVKYHREVIGAEHPRFVESVSMLGLYEAEAGRYESAVRHGREAVNMSIETFGAEDEKTLQRRGVLGRILVLAGEYDEADSLLTEVLRLFEPKVSATDRSRIVMIDALGRARMHLGAYAESDSLLQEVHRLRLDQLGPKHPWTRQTRSQIEQLYRRWGKPLPEYLTRSNPG